MQQRGTAAAVENPKRIAATAPDIMKFVHQGRFYVWVKLIRHRNFHRFLNFKSETIYPLKPFIRHIREFQVILQLYSKLNINNRIQIIIVKLTRKKIFIES